MHEKGDEVVRAINVKVTLALALAVALALVLTLALAIGVDIVNCIYCMPRLKSGVCSPRSTRDASAHPQLTLESLATTCAPNVEH